MYVTTSCIKCPGELDKSEICNVTKTIDNLRHKRLGHLHRKCLNLLGVPVFDKICSLCMTGKATRSPFKTVSKPRTSMIADMLHVDIAGPIKLLKGNSFS